MPYFMRQLQILSAFVEHSPMFVSDGSLFYFPALKFMGKEGQARGTLQQFVDNMDSSMSYPHTLILSYFFTKIDRGRALLLPV